MTYEQAIIEAIRPADPSISVKAEGGQKVFPFININVFDARDFRFIGTSVHEEEIMFQVTAAALDPRQAAALMVDCKYKLAEHADGGAPPIAWDEGEPGREIARQTGAARYRKQAGAAPDGRTVFFAEFDTAMLVQRDARRPE